MNNNLKQELKEKREQVKRVNEAFQAIEIIDEMSKKFIDTLDFDKLEQTNAQILMLNINIEKILFTDDELLFIDWLHRNTRKNIHQFIFEDVIAYWNKSIEDKCGKKHYDILRLDEVPLGLQDYPRFEDKDGIHITVTDRFTRTYKVYTLKFAYALYNIDQKKFQCYQYLSDITGSGTYTGDF